MRFVLTALILLGGIAFTLNGVGFLVQPQSLAPGFGLAADGAPGWSTMRADMTAFFLLGGVTMIWGAWKRNGDILLVPAALFGTAFLGRTVSLFADGAYPGFWQPMLVEALVTLATLIASRWLPQRVVPGALQTDP